VETNVNILNNLKQNKMQGKESDKKDLKLSALLALCILFALIAAGLMGCSKEGFLQPNRNIEMSIDTRLPKDSNGYSVFKLYSTETQNIHTISGSIRVNGKIPNEPREKIEWENNLYWNLKKGDTIIAITKTYLNYYTGQFTIVKLPPMISNVNALVPTINKVCYNSADGSINTVIAPKWEMRGDTMTIVARINNITKVEKIILK
jgi:hypothetical protein